jgi:thiopurine S-methyltransferase
LTVLEADFFALDIEALGQMDRVWDRDAFGAVDPAQREEYVRRIRALTRAGGQIMLNVFTFDQTRYAGPPYPVADVDVKGLFAGARKIQLLRRDKTRVRQPTVLQHIEGTGTDTWLIEV